MVPAYFVSICFYIDAICDDFEDVLHDLERSVNDGYSAIHLNFITALNLQITAGK